MYCVDFSLFFFELSGDHRDLHSFPTRRSSDLRSYGLELLLRRQIMKGFYGWIAYTLSKTTRLDDPSEPTYQYGWHLRSEEHTSELQSPDHLVCRLLLEKKKKKQPQRIEKIASI